VNPAVPDDTRTEHLEVARSARYHVLGSGSRVWFALHGYGQLAGPFLRPLAALADRVRLVAPEGLSRFYLRRGTGEVGASWMTREDRADEIRDTVRYLDRVLAAELGPSARMEGLLGFSQGAPAAARWVLSGGARPRVIVLWGAGLPPDSDLAGGVPDAVRSGTRWVFVHGARDETVPRSTVDRALTRARDLGLSAELVTHQGGHVVDAELLGRLVDGLG
jgi:predicted esterase